MRIRKLGFIVLMIGLAASLHGQKAAGKHTLFFYPFHRAYDPPKFTKLPFNPMLGLGYDYQLKEYWSLQLKLFLNQVNRPGNESHQSLRTNKNIKLGTQYLWIDQKLQVLLGSYVYLEDRSLEYWQTRNRLSTVSKTKEKEAGFELSFGLGYRINHQARLYLGAAFRVGTIKRIGADRRSHIFYTGDPAIERYSLMQLNPFESLGFGYTF